MNKFSDWGLNLRLGIANRRINMGNFDKKARKLIFGGKATIRGNNFADCEKSKFNIVSLCLNFEIKYFYIVRKLVGNFIMYRSTKKY